MVQVRTATDQLRCTASSETVSCYMLLEICIVCMFFHYQSQRVILQPCSRRIYEQSFFITGMQHERTNCFYIRFKALYSCFSDRNHAFLVPFSPDFCQFMREVDIIHIKVDDLTGTQTAGIHQLQNSPVPISGCI